MLFGGSDEFGRSFLSLHRLCLSSCSRALRLRSSLLGLELSHLSARFAPALHGLELRRRRLLVIRACELCRGSLSFSLRRSDLSLRIFRSLLRFQRSHLGPRLLAALHGLDLQRRLLLLICPGKLSRGSLSLSCRRHLSLSRGELLGLELGHLGPRLLAALHSLDLQRRLLLLVRARDVCRRLFCFGGGGCLHLSFGDSSVGLSRGFLGLELSHLSARFAPALHGLELRRRRLLVIRACELCRISGFLLSRRNFFLETLDILTRLLALVHRLNLRRCVVLNNGRQRTSHQPANSLLQLLSVRRPGLLRRQTLRVELLELIKVQLAVAVSVVVLHQRLCVRHKVRVGDVQAELSQHVQQLTLLELPGPVGVESVECFPDGVRVCHRARHPWSPSVVVSYPTLPLNWELQMSHSSDEDCSPLALVLARERRFLTVCDSTNRSGARAAGCHGRHRPRAASSVR